MPTQWSPEFGRKWALGYLAGRARAYRRGNQPLAAVTGAVRTARERGVTDDAIVEALQESSLSWDPIDGVIDVTAQ